MFLVEKQIMDDFLCAEYGGITKQILMNTWEKCTGLTKHNMVD